jgi:hypothetical protein
MERVLARALRLNSATDHTGHHKIARWAGPERVSSTLHVRFWGNKADIDQAKNALAPKSDFASALAPSGHGDRAE